MGEPAPIDPLANVFDDRFNRSMSLAQRMHLVMTRVDYIQKQPKKQGMNYSFVSHDSVTALIREHTVACGIIYYPLNESAKFTVDGNRCQLVMAVRFESIDDADDFKDVLGIGFGIDPGDKGPGKAISYATKYALLKAFGLETGDDPDQDQNVQHRTSLQQKADELEKTMVAAQDAPALRAIVTEPATAEIYRALAGQNQAEYRRMRQVMAREAKRVSLDLATLGDQS